MKKFLTIILALAFGLTVTAQSTQTNVIKNAVKDYDGNSYDAVQIGEQVWMQSNLRTTHYADGTTIELGKESDTKKAYRYYPNDEPKNVPTYGYLYNWTAAMHGAHSSETNPSGIQGICPNGWHLPSNAEWSQLTDFVNHQSLYWCDGDSNKTAKAYAATTRWKIDLDEITDEGGLDNCIVGNNMSENNATGFSAIPAGSQFGGFGTVANFWTATDEGRYYAIGRFIDCYFDYFNEGAWYDDGGKDFGVSVRCIRNSKSTPAPPQIIPLETPQHIPLTAKIIKNAVKDYDNNDYDAVQIGEQIWMASNLRTTHYADGRSIALGRDFSAETPLCYYPNNSYSNVTNYGYLYNWAAVMHGASSSTTNPSGVQGICPKGWHVPSQDEWQQLKEYVKKQNKYICDCEYDHQGIAKSLASNTGWYISIGECAIGNNQQNNNSTGFSAVPAGLYYYSNFEGLGDLAVFWSSTIAKNYKTTSGESCAYDYYLKYRGVVSLPDEGTSVKNALSVRCVYNFRDSLLLVREREKVERENRKKGELIKQGYVDLGLPSGTMWKDKNEGSSFYSYEEASSTFGNSLPNKSQWEELQNQCQWKWTGSGYKIIGPNGNFIVLPAAGNKDCTGKMYGVGTHGGYWSSSYSNSYNAWFFGFSSEDIDMASYLRCSGFSVRLARDCNF